MFRGLSTMRCAATTSLLSRGWLQTLTHTTKPSTGYAVARVLIAPLSISSSNAKGVEEVTVRNPVIEDYPVVQTLDVQWGEMDAFQHVNNVTYFRYFETARMEYFERIQYLQHMDKGKGGPILGETTCKYKVPIEYPDRLSIGVRVQSMTDTQMIFEYCVKSLKKGVVAATGTSKIVNLDYKSGKRAIICDELRASIASLEGKSLDVLESLPAKIN